MNNALRRINEARKYVPRIQAHYRARYGYCVAVIDEGSHWLVVRDERVSPGMWGTRERKLWSGQFLADAPR